MAAGAAELKAGLKVFVSYSRRDREIADAIVAALEASGFEMIIDRRDLPYGEEWQHELSDFIRSCDTVIWLVSPDSVASQWCNWELGEVARTRKRLMPVRVRDIDPAKLPAAIGRIHLLPAESVFTLERDLPTLIEALNTDRAWIKEASRLADRARQWRAKDRSGALLLWGTPLKEAETWKDRQPRGAPPVSEEVLELILASRRAATTRGRWWVAASLAVAAIGIGLAGLAYWQREVALVNESKAVANERRAVDNERAANEQRALAQENERVAQANEERARANEQAANQQRIENLKSGSRLAAVSAQQLVDENRPALAQAIALEGLPQQNPPERPVVDETLKTLHRAVRADRSIVTLTAQGENVLSVAFSLDGKTLLTGTSAGNLIVWDLDGFQRRRHIATGNDVVSQVDISPDGTLALVAGGRFPAIYEIASGKPVLKLPEIKNGTARTARFSPDGKTIAIGHTSDRAELRDAATGALLHEFNGPDDFAAAYERRVSHIFGPSNRNDPIVRQVEEAFWGMFGGMTEVLFTPDGRSLVTAGAADAEGAARIFDVVTGQLTGTLRGDSLVNNFSNQRIAVSHDGRFLAITSRDRLVRLWDPKSNKLLHTLPHTAEAGALAFDASGEFLAAGYHDGSVRIWSTADGVALAVLSAHLSDVMSVSFSPDRRLLATASGDRTVRLWWNTLVPERCRPDNRRSCNSGMRPAGALRGHTDIAHLAAFSSDGATLASVSRDETVRLWRTEDAGTRTLPFRSASEPKEPLGGQQLFSFIEAVNNIAFTPDGKQLVAADHLNGFTVWDVARGTVTCRVQGDRLARMRDGGLMIYQSPLRSRPFDCASPHESAGGPAVSDHRWVLSPDGTRAVAAKEWLEARQDGKKPLPADQEPRRLLDLTQRTTIATLSIGKRFTYRTAFSPDSSIVVGGLIEKDETGGARRANEYAVWDTATGQLLGTTGRWQPEFDVLQFSHTGRQFVLATTGFSRVVHFTVRDDKRLQWRTMAGPRRTVASATISARGDVVAAGYDDGSVVLFSAADGKPRTNLFAGGHPVRHLSFSPDMRILAGWDDSQTVWAWDVATGLALASTTLKNKPVAIVFSPDSDRLAVQTDEASMHVMTVDLSWLALERPEDLIDWARGSLSATSDGDRQRFLMQASGPRAVGRPLLALEPAAIPAAKARHNRPPALASCDALAASPADRDRQADGLAIERIDVRKALAACEAAVAEASNDPHALYQLGRVLERMKRMADAMKYYRAAAETGYAVAIRRIAQLIVMKNPAAEDLGPATQWYDRAAAAGDPFALRMVARRIALGNGMKGVNDALRFAAAAHGGNIANGTLQLALDLDGVARTDEDRERVFFYFQLGQRWVSETDTEVAARLKDETEARLRVLPRQLKPVALVRQYRAARDWKPL
jgi:WD40 repeat protein